MKIDDFVAKIIKAPNFDNFTTSDVRSSYIALKNDPSLDPIVVRRKLIDSKSELKQSIFGFHQKPETDDFPTGITALLFDRTTKMVDAYDEYYKTKGLRSTTRPELL